MLLTLAQRWVWLCSASCPPKGHVPTLASVPPTSPCHRGLTASTRLLALPWNCLLLPAVWLGTVRDTGLALLGLPQSELSGNRELQCTDGKLLLSFSLDSAPSRRSVGMGCCGQPRLQGVAGGVAHSRENVVGEWLRWRRGLRPATASACRERETHRVRTHSVCWAGTAECWRIYLHKAQSVLRLKTDDLSGLFQL